MTIDADYLRSVLSYNQDTGDFIWIVSNSNRTPIGSKAGTPDGRGYIQIMVNKKKYKAHVLAWLYVHGVYPEIHLDHKNCDKKDNRISNLRLATKSENGYNRKKYSNNKSGYKGVWISPNGKFVSEIRHNGKKIKIGTFECPELAHLAYCEFSAKLHGVFSRTD
jgi:hypothetical protein